MQKVFITKVFLFIILIAGTLYFLLYKSQPIATSDEVNTLATVSESVEVRYAPDGWQEYQNTAYNFSLFYPQELVTKEYLEENNAATITFQNAEKGIGFQIFIVPYSEQQISEDRFKKDIPSGVRTNLSDIMVDGATGVAFYSRDYFLGDTREAWFIRSGFLYEVTTLRSFESTLLDILQSWKFSD